MAYTPELSQEYSATLRRLAWALDMPMTKAINALIDHCAQTVENVRICKKCKDQTACKTCVFHNNKGGEAYEG